MEGVGNNDLLSDKQVNKVLKHSTFQLILPLYNEPYEMQFYKWKYEFTIKHA